MIVCLICFIDSKNLTVLYKEKRDKKRDIW